MQHGVGETVKAMRGHLTGSLPIDDLVDLVRVVGVLGVVLGHPEAFVEVLQSAAEVGLPFGLVVWKLVDFTTGDGPCLRTDQTRAQTYVHRRAHVHTRTRTNHGQQGNDASAEKDRWPTGAEECRND